MGFWNEVFKSIKDGAIIIWEFIKKTTDEIQEYTSEYKKLSNEELIKEYKRVSGMRKNVCMSLLQERGILKNKK